MEYLFHNRMFASARAQSLRCGRLLSPGGGREDAYPTPPSRSQRIHASHLVYSHCVVQICVIYQDLAPHDLPRRPPHDHALRYPLALLVPPKPHPRTRHTCHVARSYFNYLLHTLCTTYKGLHDGSFDAEGEVERTEGRAGDGGVRVPRADGPREQVGLARVDRRE